MTAAQLRFGFGFEPDLSRRGFIPAPSNAKALEVIEQWPHWPASILALVGPAGCGKSHLSRIWQDRSDASQIEMPMLNKSAVPDIDGSRPWLLDVPAKAIDPQAFFHLFNLIKSQKGHLLICSDRPLARWGVALADAQSRLSSVPTFEIKAPEDELLKAILRKHFSDRQVKVESDLLDYLVARMERSASTADRLVEKLDEIAWAEGAPISKKIAKKALEAV